MCSCLVINNVNCRAPLNKEQSNNNNNNNNNNLRFYCTAPETERNTDISERFNKSLTFCKTAAFLNMSTFPRPK